MIEKKRIKVAMVFPYAPSYREPIYSLMDEAFDCTFFFCGDSHRNLKYMDYSVLKHVNTELKDSSWHGLRFYRGISKIDFSNFDIIVHPGTLRNPSSWFLQIKMLFRKGAPKIVLWTHGWYGKESKIEKILKKIYFSMVDQILLYGNYAKDGLAALGVKPEKLKVIYNSLDYDAQLKLRQSIVPSDIYKEHFGNDNKVLICICRLELRKRIDFLFDALGLLNNGEEQYNVVIIGDGQDKEHLVSKVKEKRIENNVWFYGACYNEKVNAELLYNADLCVVPGDVGLTAIHSMMFGTPLITHNCFKYQGPEFESVKPMVTGCFFEHNNVKSLADKIADWFIQNKDRNKVRSECFREIDRTWNPHVQLDILRQSFYEILC